ncbi:MAG TPA: hypothetical protein VNA19_07110 [Pyrinomonadaceae bacterium]|jgi:hypothetical protein|nr:hypothetical protein [Pyrinomonadaceae bacterium]
MKGFKIIFIKAGLMRAALGVGLVFASVALSPFDRFPLSPFAPRAHAQEVVDKWVAVINGRELITYTDLLWQLALQPNVPLDNPRAEDLERALQLIIDQRLISQEAEKLPTITPRAAEVEAGLKELIARFPSQAEFYQRLARVGLGENSEQLREIVRQRVAIENYIDFRFRSFTVVTPQEVSDYYRDVFVPRWRQQSPGRLVPSFEDKRAEIEKQLAESKIGSEADKFLEDARTRAEITILNQP